MKKDYGTSAKHSADSTGITAAARGADSNGNKTKRRNVMMKKYVCEPCGYVYDPEVGDPDGGIAPGTAFEDIPDDWVCPICGMGKDVFAEE